MGEGLFHLGRFLDFGTGNPPVVAPAVGRQDRQEKVRPEGRTEAS